MRVNYTEDLAIAEQLSSSSPRLEGQVVPGKGKKVAIENFERKKPTEKILNGMIDRMSFWHKWVDGPIAHGRQRRRRRGPRTLVAQGYIPSRKLE